MVVCLCQSQSSNLSLSLLPPGNHKFVFYTWNSIYLVVRTYEHMTIILLNFLYGLIYWLMYYVCGCLVAQSCPTLVTPQTIACQAPLSLGFSAQEHWNGLPWPPPEDLPGLVIKPASLISPALACGFFTISATWKTLHCLGNYPISKLYSLRLFRNICIFVYV